MMHAIISRDIHDNIAVLNHVSVDTTVVPTIGIFSSESENPKNDKDGKEVCNVSNGHISYNESPSFSEQPTARDKKWELNNDTLEADGKAEVDDKYFFRASSPKKKEGISQSMII
jgi:hypothetical protein